MEEIHFSSLATPQRWEFWQWNPRSEKDLPVASSHNTANCAFRVTLRNGAQWAIDLGSAQFGFSQSLVAWNTYAQQRINPVHQIYRFGHTLTVQVANHSRTSAISTGQKMVVEKYWIQLARCAMIRNDLRVIGHSEHTTENRSL